MDCIHLGPSINAKFVGIYSGESNINLLGDEVYVINNVKDFIPTISNMSLAMNMFDQSSFAN